MWPFSVQMNAKHPLYTHAVSETVCVCVRVGVCVSGVIIYKTLRINEAISHNAYSLTWWAGLRWVVMMSARRYKFTVSADDVHEYKHLRTHL